MMTIGVCITTHNEAWNIGALVEQLCHFAFRVYVVDAGSTDGTWRKASDAGANAVMAETRLPIADAMWMAWDRAIYDDCERIIQIDAGGSHDPREAIRLSSMLKRADVVIGSRFALGARYIGNPPRALLSRLATRMCNLKTGAKLTDWTSGYRAFTRDAILKLKECDYQAHMHGWQIEVLQAARRLEMKIVEVPITYRAGRSSFDSRIAREAYRVWRNL